MMDLIIFPFGGNAREALLTIHELNRRCPTWDVQGFVDDNESHWGKEYSGVKVIGGKNILSHYPHAFLLAVPGNPGTFANRSAVISSLGIPLCRFATVIDPDARISPDARVGVNSLIMANVFVSCQVEIGNHCVVLPNTVISHDSKVGEYTLIGSNVSISGSCTVQSACYIGSGSRIKDHIKIGPNSLIGLGSCVIKDVPGNVIAAGNPARILKNNGGGSNLSGLF